MTVLHLVRHGESEWNLAGRVQGQSPLAGPLTATGRAQALVTARLIEREHPHAEAIFCSDLGRARETADIIAGVLGLPVKADPALREHQLGAFEGRRFADPLGDGTVEAEIDGLWRHPDRQAPDGESVTDLYVRVHEALDGYAAQYPDGELVLVAHGGVVRVATAPEDPRLGGPVPRRPVANATVTTLQLDGNRASR
jgi:2,3-bisphosphoglycerate-dependent phosphoglycerate mutase